MSSWAYYNECKGERADLLADVLADPDEFSASQVGTLRGFGSVVIFVRVNSAFIAATMGL